MGRRTNGKPKATDSFLRRVCNALDEPPRLLAANIGIEFRELRPLLTGRQQELVELDRDATWFRINEYVAKRIGALTAIKWELDKALQADRAERMKRVEKFKKATDGKDWLSA